MSLFHKKRLNRCYLKYYPLLTITYSYLSGKSIPLFLMQSMNRSKCYSVMGHRSKQIIIRSDNALHLQAFPVGLGSSCLPCQNNHFQIIGYSQDAIDEACLP